MLVLFSCYNGEFSFFVVGSPLEEAYVVQGLLSYARRYWRKSLIKKTVTPEAVQLQAVCRPNDRRARESCRKFVQKPGGETVHACVKKVICVPPAPASMSLPTPASEPVESWLEGV